MNITKATLEDFQTIYQIVHHTIQEVYPNYYPSEVVDFFLQHHNEENITTDLKKGIIYLITEENQIVATGTVDGSYIGRVYVLPEYQGKGYGREIMSYLETLIPEEYPSSCLEASLPSYEFYLKMGYQPTRYYKYEVENGRYLCYYQMEKPLSADTSLKEDNYRTTQSDAADYSAGAEEIRAFYNNYGIREWDRLELNAYSRINFHLHMDFIKAHLFPGAKVLDAGCGAGRYSLELAKAGCQVTLFDISEEQLRIAKAKAKESHLEQQMSDYIRGDIRDLSIFPDNYFDIVLCYGAPLSYVTEGRDTAIKELTRVTKMNGIIAVSVNNKWGILKTLLGDCYPDFFSNKEYWYIDKVIAYGDLPKHEKVAHPARHFFEAAELKDLMQLTGLQNIMLGGSPVFSCGNKSELEELAKSEEAFQLIVDLELKTYQKPTMIDNGEFLLAKGQKK